MENYQDKTREELLEIVQAQAGLAEAVEAKNDEMTRLKGEHKKALKAKDDAIEDLKREHTKDIERINTGAAEKLSAKTTELIALSKKLNDLEKNMEIELGRRLGAAQSEVGVKLQEEQAKNTFLTKAVKRREGEVSKLLGYYESLLRVLQGTIDIHVDLDAEFSEKVRGE